MQIAGVHGDHATQNVEYGGSGVASLSINARKTLTTMSAELSAEFATVEAEEADPIPTGIDELDRVLGGSKETPPMRM